MDRVMRAAWHFTRWGYWLGGALMLVIAFVIGADVLLRKFANVTLGGADELAGFAMAIGIAWGLGGALLDRAHIRIDSLYVHFGRRLRVILDFVSLIVFMAFSAML